MQESKKYITFAPIFHNIEKSRRRKAKSQPSSVVYTLSLHSPAMHQISIAIIDANVLTAIGLQRLLEEIIPPAEIMLFGSFDDMLSNGETTYVHYFVSSRIYFEHASFFRENMRRSIVLVNGDMSIAGVKTINVCQSENSIVRDILSMHQRGHGSSMMPDISGRRQEVQLTPREIEVAVLLCKGHINKEIADILNISVTTVISHRKNIMEKLQARSLANIIIYAVMTGMVDVAELK